MPENNQNILALDVGEKRVGVAFARADVRIPVVLTTLERQGGDFWDELSEIKHQNQIELIVIGLPRGLDGQETAQTEYAQQFAIEIKEKLALPIKWQDEALTSVRAKEILDKSGQPYQKADIDALAASLILSDYLNSEKVSA